MKKNKEKDNLLIKRKNLLLEIKKFDIKRVSPDTILLFDRYFKKELNIILSLIEEELKIKGKKTLEKNDVNNVLKKLKEEEYWET